MCSCRSARRPQPTSRTDSGRSVCGAVPPILVDEDPKAVVELRESPSRRWRRTPRAVRTSATTPEASGRNDAIGRAVTLGSMVARARRRPAVEGAFRTGSRRAVGGRLRVSAAGAPASQCFSLCCCWRRPLLPRSTAACAATTRTSAIDGNGHMRANGVSLFRSRRARPSTACSIRAGRCRSASPQGTVYATVVPERLPVKFGIALMSLACFAALMAFCSRSESLRANVFLAVAVAFALVPAVPCDPRSDARIQRLAAVQRARAAAWSHSRTSRYLNTRSGGGTRARSPRF